MKKQLKDYLHFYLGCDIPEEDGHTCKVIGIVDNDVHMIHNYHNQYGTMPIENAKPILRPLSDMTENEKKEAHDIYYTDKIELLAIMDVAHFELCRYLLSKHFDVFGLHEAGLCLYRNEKGGLY